MDWRAFPKDCLRRRPLRPRHPPDPADAFRPDRPDSQLSLGRRAPWTLRLASLPGSRTATGPSPACSSLGRGSSRRPRRGRRRPAGTQSRHRSSPRATGNVPPLAIPAPAPGIPPDAGKPVSECWGRRFGDAEPASNGACLEPNPLGQHRVTHCRQNRILLCRQARHSVSSYAYCWICACNLGEVSRRRRRLFPSQGEGHE